jgi:type I restriction enzyme R subunit
LPVFFTLRHEATWDLDEAGMDEAFGDAFADRTKEEKLAIIQDELSPSDLGELRPRIETYAQLIAEHFQGVEENGWKGMVVAPSKASAALYADCLLQYREEEDVAVLYTQGEPHKDSDLVKRFYTTADERDAIVKRFNKKEQPKLLVVHQMLLTGFDAPILKTMYLDRRLTDHNLLQAIARTNRPADGKSNGEIVDFQGVFANLDEALHYDADTRHYAARDKDQLFANFEEQLDLVFELFDGIDKENTQEAMQAALARVSKHPRRRQFKQGFKRLQDLYESVSPDKRLVQLAVQNKYQWLSRVWIAFRRANNRDPNPEDSVREKTRKIVEEHVDVTQVKEDFPIYKIGEEHLEAVKQFSDPAARASSIAHTTQSHLHPRIDQNPRYKTLSERVQEVLSRWQNGNMADPEAVDALERLEREAIAVEEEAEAYRPAEYATYVLLTDEYDVNENEAQALAEAICDRFEADVDRTYPNWHRNEAARRKAKVAILKALAQEGHKDLIRDGFPTEALDYVIGNYADD